MVDMSRNYSQGRGGTLPYGWEWAFGFDPQRKPSLSHFGNPIPGYYARRAPGFESTNASGLMPPNQSIKANSGNALPDWAKKLLASQGGYQSKYEPMLEALLKNQAPNAGPNPYTSKISSLADQIANFRPSGQLPPEVAARLATMKSAALAGVDRQANSASDKLAGMLWENTGGGTGSAEMSARASLAHDIGTLRGGVEGQFADKELQALNEYNGQRLAALQAGMSGYGSAGQFQNSDVDRMLGNFYNSQGMQSGILDRLLSSERDRNDKRTNLIMELMGRYGA